MADFSTRLKNALSIRNMKPIELSKKTGIDKGSISLYLKGKYIPKSNKIYKMAKVLNVNPSWLLGYDVPMTINGTNETYLSKLTTFLNKIDYGDIEEYVIYDKKKNHEIFLFLEISDIFQIYWDSYFILLKGIVTHYDEMYKQEKGMYFQLNNDILLIKHKFGLEEKKMKLLTSIGNNYSKDKLLTLFANSTVLLDKKSNKPINDPKIRRMYLKKIMDETVEVLDSDLKSNSRMVNQ